MQQKRNARKKGHAVKWSLINACKQHKAKINPNDMGKKRRQVADLILTKMHITAVRYRFQQMAQ